MYLNDQVPVLIFHVLEANVTQNACVVDQDVDSPKFLDGCLDYTLAIYHIVVVGNSLSASSPDFIDNDISSLND